MTSIDSDLLSSLLRTLVREAINEGAAKARTPTILTGTVEALSEELDVVFIRMDQEALGGDPMQSQNYEAPGIIPATRLGSTYTDEQVRVEFDGSAGASAMQTSVENRIILPFGTEVGQRVELKGETGTIEFYNADDVLVGFLDPTQWFLGKPGASLARLDPLGGLRLRDDEDILRVLLSASEGLTLRDPATGISGLIARADRLVSVDPATGEQILIGSGVSSSIPTPRWASVQHATASATLPTPAIASFQTSDDIDLRFVAASAPSDLGAPTTTPPASYTERTDISDNGNGITLSTSSATRDPAVAAPGAANFTSTASTWQRRLGHSVIIRGGGATSPAFRASATSGFVTAGTREMSFTIPVPAGVVEGDLMVAHVAIASSAIPIGWTVPDGWQQLGVQVAGLGTTHVLGSGIWFKRAGSAEPASYTVSINMSELAVTKVHATGIAVSTPFATTLTGLDIRIGPRSLPRGRIAEQIIDDSADNFTLTTSGLTDFALNNVFLLGGRRYNIKWMTTLEWGTVTANAAEWRFMLRINGVDHARLVTWKPFNNGGLARFIWRADSDFIPASDGFYTFTIFGDEVVDGANIVFQAGSTVPRSLVIDDAGGTF